MTAVLATQSCPDPAATALWLASCMDGVVLDQLTGPSERRMSRADLHVLSLALVRGALA